MENMTRALKLTRAIDRAIIRGRGNTLAELLGYDPQELTEDAAHLTREAFTMPLTDRARNRLTVAGAKYTELLKARHEKPDAEGIAPHEKTLPEIELDAIEEYIANLARRA